MSIAPQTFINIQKTNIDSVCLWAFLFTFPRHPSCTEHVWILEEDYLRPQLAPWMRCILVLPNVGKLALPPSKGTEGAGCVGQKWLLTVSTSTWTAPLPPGCPRTVPLGEAICDEKQPWSVHTKHHVGCTCRTEHMVTIEQSAEHRSSYMGKKRWQNNRRFSCTACVWELCTVPGHESEFNKYKAVINYLSQPPVLLQHEATFYFATGLLPKARNNSASH